MLLPLLLHRLFHADGVHHQFQVGQDFRLVAPDVALYGPVGQQFGQVTLGHDEVEQVGSVGAFGILVLLLHLAHLFTAAATVPEDTRWLFLPAQRRVYAEAYGFRMWVHIARGSAVGIGSHAGYMTSDPGGGIVVTKAECDAQPQGWKLVEGVVGISAMMTTFGNGFSIGFSSTEEVEAYIAMPYVYAFLHPGNAGMSMGD